MKLKVTIVNVALRGTSIVAKLMLTIMVGRLMGLTDLGLYGLISAGTILVPAVASLGLMSLVGRELVRQTPAELIFNLKHYGPVVALFYLLAIPLGFLVATRLGYPPVLALLTVAVIALEHVSGDAITILNNRTRYLLANVILFIKSGAWMIVFVAIALLWPAAGMATLDHLLVFWSLACGLAILVFLFATRSWPWLGVLPTRLSLDWYRRRSRNAALLLVNDISNNVALYVDRYILVLFLGLEASGIYFFFWSATNAAFNVVQTGVVWAHRGHMIKAHGQSDEATFAASLRSLIRESASITLALSAGLLIVFPFVVGLLDQAGTGQYPLLLWLLVAGLALRVAVDIAGQALYTRGLDELLVSTSFAMLPLSVALNVALTPLLGIYGAAVAWIVNCGLIIAVRTIFFDARAPRPTGLTP
ncbi:MAG: hypothetical protein ABI399_09855 [Bauldia sp.]